MSDQTCGYRPVDHFARRTVETLSKVIGVRNITRPFWNRWRGSHLPDSTIMEFLQVLPSLEKWPEASKAFLDEQEQKFRYQQSGLSDAEQIAELRRLSFLAFLSQWGCLEMSPLKRELYGRCRDLYIEVESRFFSASFQRLAVPWKGMTLYANIHRPKPSCDTGRSVIILHGMDDVKEEHLATEHILAERGYSVICYDGPGQGEALIQDGIVWPADFHESATSVLDAAAETGFPVDAVGAVGISWGGMWAFKAAAHERRIRAVYDLGGPVDSRSFDSIPYFMKSKFCQVLGVSDETSIEHAKEVFSIRDGTIERINVPVRIVHGAKDPMVPVKDKEFLRDSLTLTDPSPVELLVYPDGDHCCTGHLDEVRLDAVGFFDRVLAGSRTTAISVM